MALFALLIAGSFSLGARAAPFIESGALNAIRFAFAVILMGVVMLASTSSGSRRAALRPKALWRFGVLGALMGFYFITMFLALKVTDPVSTGAVFTLMPLMTAGFAYLFLRQVAGPTLLASLVVAAAGAVWVIFRGDIDALLSFDVGRGETIFFFGCMAHGAYAALTDHCLDNHRLSGGFYDCSDILLASVRGHAHPIQQGDRIWLPDPGLYYHA